MLRHFMSLNKSSADSITTFFSPRGSFHDKEGPFGPPSGQSKDEAMPDIANVVFCPLSPLSNRKNLISELLQSAAGVVVHTVFPFAIDAALGGYGVDFPPK